MLNLVNVDLTKLINIVQFFHKKRSQFVNELGLILNQIFKYGSEWLF